MNHRFIAIFCLSGALVANPAMGQDLSAYRGVHLGNGLPGVIGAIGARPADVKIVHERPVLMQDLEWHLRSLDGLTITNDPVRRVVFSFYQDQLYRIFVTYDRTRIDGLTDPDLIESLSAAYGLALTSEAAKVLRPLETPDVGEQYRVVARWEDAEHSIVLLRGSYLVPLSLVMLAKHVATDARHAGVEAVRLNLSERPARAALKARQDAEARQLAQEKVRPTNKAAFKP